MAWSCVQPSKSLRPTQISRQKVQLARRSRIDSLLVKCQLLIFLLQYNVGEVGGPQ